MNTEVLHQIATLVLCLVVMALVVNSYLMKRRLRRIFLDIDKRLKKLEEEGEE